MKRHVSQADKDNKPKKVEDRTQPGEKKPFDKKKYRLQKYSNKYKLQQWEERRKKAVLRNYYKELEKEEKQNRQTSKRDENDIDSSKNGVKKVSAFSKAKQEFLRKEDEKRKKKEEILRTKAEKEEALKKYKEQKMQKFKKLSKKTKKGQPVMKDRLEMLLEKIQESVCN